MMTANLVACSAGTGSPYGASGGPPSGVAETKTLGNVSQAEWATLCDWLAGVYGGYGQKRTISCEAGTSTKSAPPDRATCLSSMNVIPDGCNATVSEFESCFNTLSVQCVGGLPSACAKLTQAECGPVLKSTTIEEGGSSGGGTVDGGGSCSREYTCGNGACTCKSGPKAGAACCTTSNCEGGPEEPSACETLCQYCK